ncbi:hypothetical protein LJR225_003334 [Phenylobacterium sp. LjRoot225]|uniref:hypothetical protein n=1 Tax=Phenylobacterium sp. LjRoot225 TaxID=3342285 RepID=UPI003ED15656
MLDLATTSNPTAQTDAQAAPAGVGLPRALIERQLQVLGRLAEAGLNLALAIERQATTEEAAQVVEGDAALAFARVSRAVRLTLALQSRAIKDLQALDQVAAGQLYADRCNAERERRQLAKQRQDRVQRIVERVIGAEAADAAEVDRLADEACERLEHDDIYGDLTARPVGEIIARVCRDLGLSPDWSRLAEEAWAQDEIRSGAPGSPFASSPLASPQGLDPPEPQGAADPGPAEPQAASP